MGPMNSNKNKLNNKINRQKLFLPNTHLVWSINHFKGVQSLQTSQMKPHSIIIIIVVVIIIYPILIKLN